MSEEDFPNLDNRDYHQLETEWNQRDHVRSIHRDIRRQAKNLRDYLDLGAGAAELANREKVRNLVNEILALVPVYDVNDEAVDNQDRQESVASRKRYSKAHQEWKKNQQ